MGKNENRKHSRFRTRFDVFKWVLVGSLCRSFSFCSSVNDEGFSLLRLKERVVNDPFGALTNWTEAHEADPCSWFGVQCSGRNVVVLNLKDLSLEGTLPSDLANLVHIKAINLRNNSFNGRLPQGLGKLKNLGFLDLRFNNFTGSVPNDLFDNPSLKTFLLDNNLQLSKPVQGLLGSEKRSLAGKAGRRILNEMEIAAPPPKNQSSSGSPPSNSSSAPPSNSSSSSDPGENSSAPPPPPSNLKSPPVPSSQTEIPAQPPPPPESKPSKGLRPVILAAVLGGIIFLLLFAVGFYFWKTNRKTGSGSWATGLSGPLQKALVVGVPKLKRSELEAACEDFSNIIGSWLFGTLYKGTLPSGIEIAVASVAEKSNHDWSRRLEAQFKKKIETLFKANHKNFINLLGYCEEEEPFTRMIVLEYAPNGTLFEHLHIQEAEHLDWGTRLRIAMGIAYCLDHLHKLNPPLMHNNLTSLSVSLTEDYAAKISEFSFPTEMASSGRSSTGISRVNSSTGGLKSNVHSFGMILFEMMTGRMLKSPVEGEDEKAYLRGSRSLREMVDPALTHFQIDQLEQIGEVIKWCLNSETKQKPSMAEVSLKLRSITGVSPEEAVSKVSPLWWAELEIMSVDGK